MVDGSAEYDPYKAYEDSKLCNVIFTRELQRRLDASGSNIKVNSFTPGLIVGTGLFRDQNKVFTKVFDIAATNLLKVGETPHYGGGALEYMALSSKVGEKGGLYYYSAPGSSKYGDDAYGKQFDVREVSREARESDDNGKAKRFWELSEKLVGI
jgi:protochlorophyllide reductase